MQVSKKLAKQSKMKKRDDCNKKGKKLKVESKQWLTKHENFVTYILIFSYWIRIGKLKCVNLSNQ